MDDERMIEALRTAGFDDAANRIKNLTTKAHRNDRKSPACDALRMAGYMVLPRWWVTADQYEVIERIVSGNKGEVFRIKRENS